MRGFTMEKELKEKIEARINSDRVFLFMKGTPQSPMCGFSAGVIQVLEKLSVKYSTFNIFDDADIRQGIKEYANWPTIPQLYVDSEFIGGHDIIVQMAQSGELKKTLEKKE